jgi:anion-transporting  ArsA/GET3 family ATPase
MSTSSEPTATLAAPIADAHVLVVTGAGGVGKTTVAAALGLAAAEQGRRTLVLTMGIDELTDDPSRVQADLDGELWAMMLDMQTTFDRLIDRHATSKSNARAIKENRIYRTLSSTLSGTQEYMAMERLHELHETGEWDLLIIDTPPSRSALDFLDAPKRMTSFLEGRLLRLLMKPGMAAGKRVGRAVNFGATTFMRVAGRVTGMELLDDLAQFFKNFEGMYQGFKERAEQVLELLQETSSQFVIVTSPEPPPLREAKFFLQRLEQEGLHQAGVVINRIRPLIDDEPDDAALLGAADAQQDSGEGRAVAATLRLLAEVRNLGHRQRRDVSAALYGVTTTCRVEVPLLGGDVHDLEGLGEIATTLTASRPS